MENKVELIGYYGGDEIIACSAWTSTSRNLSEDKKNRIDKMILQLWADGHKTPFEKGIVHFLVDSDIASNIHLLKHRIASINAESARYKELKEYKYYIPEDWVGVKLSEESSRYGSFSERLGVNHDWASILENYTKIGNELYHAALKDLEPVLGRKRAKESARFFKAYNSQIQGDVMFNMSSFGNFLKLRDSGKAQVEIREIAQKMVKLLQQIEGNPFQYTLKAFGYETSTTERLR